MMFSADRLLGARFTGHVWVRVKITNPLMSIEIEEDALVDTGATYTVVPQRIYAKLDLRVVGTKEVETAKGLI